MKIITGSLMARPILTVEMIETLNALPNVTIINTTEVWFKGTPKEIENALLENIHEPFADYLRHCSGILQGSVKASFEFKKTEFLLNTDWADAVEDEETLDPTELQAALINLRLHQLKNPGSILATLCVSHSKTDGVEHQIPLNVMLAIQEQPFPPLLGVVDPKKFQQAVSDITDINNRLKYFSSVSEASSAGHILTTTIVDNNGRFELIAVIKPSGELASLLKPDQLTCHFGARGYVTAEQRNDKHIKRWTDIVTFDYRPDGRPNAKCLLDTNLDFLNTIQPAVE